MPITDVFPHNHVRHLVAEGRGSTLIETSLPAWTRRSTAAALKITAVPSGEHHLLMIEDISDRVLFERQLVESEKQAAMGLLAGTILREVTNPIADLGSSLLLLRSILDTLDVDEVKQALDISLDRMDRVRQLLGTLPRFPVHTPSRYEIVDLHEVIRSCLTLIASDAERRNIRLATSFATPSVWCEVDVHQIRQVLLNLLTNAMEAMPAGGRLDVTTRHRDGGAEERPVALIQVADTGVGIADDNLRKVFRPLFSTKPRGAGLGLSFCRQTVEDHGGQIRVSSLGVNLGTVSTVSLPLHRSGISRGDA